MSQTSKPINPFLAWLENEITQAVAHQPTLYSTIRRDILFEVLANFRKNTVPVIIVKDESETRFPYTPEGVETILLDWNWMQDQGNECPNCFYEPGYKWENNQKVDNPDDMYGPWNKLKDMSKCPECGLPFGETDPIPFLLEKFEKEQKETDESKTV